MTQGYAPVSLDDDDAPPPTYTSSTTTHTDTVSNNSTHHTTTSAPPTGQQQQQQTASVVSQSSASTAVNDFFDSIGSTFNRVTGTTTTAVPATTAPTSSNNNSSSSNMIDNISAQLQGNEETLTLFNKLKSRDWRGTVRPPTVFVNPRAFSKPATSTDATQRLEQNLSYYFTNYTLVFLIITLFSILSDPTIIILMVLLAAVWSLAMRRDTIHIGQTQLAGRTKMIALSTVSGVLIFIFAGSVIFSIIGTSSVLICLHAVFNDRLGEPAVDASNDLELSQV